MEICYVRVVHSERAPLDEDLDLVVDKRRDAFGRKRGGQGDRNGLTIMSVNGDLSRERDGKRPRVRAGQSSRKGRVPSRCCWLCHEGCLAVEWHGAASARGALVWMAHGG
jgi:hypothetical protein